MLDLYFKFILEDDDTYLSNVDKLIVREWIKNNYRIYGDLTISDDLVVDCAGHVRVKDNSITSLTNGLFRWGNIGGNFSCSNCNNLITLERAPKNVGGNFWCDSCNKLETLEGSPKEVGLSFICSYCNNLTSLEGGPKEVGTNFICSYCPNLKITDSDRERYKLHDI